MAAVTLPLLNMRHNGPRGVGSAGQPLKALRQFKAPPPDLVAQETKKLQAEKGKLVAGLRSGALRPRASQPPPTWLTPRRRLPGSQRRTWTARSARRSSCRS